MNLSENIKQNRKAMNMTQEQLAEAVGVTVGAVSKWESGSTTPDLEMLILLAELFQTSTDALLDFQLEGEDAEALAQAIRECTGGHAYGRGRVKCEKALQRFPNHFAVVYRSAVFFEMQGFEQQDRDAVRQAIGLYQRALGLLEQNRDPEIGARAIRVRISQCHQCLEEHQQALDILRSCNEGGLYNDLLGTMLCRVKRFDEAMQVLSESFLDSVDRIQRAAVGMADCLGNGTREPAQALELMKWLAGFLESLYPGGSCYLHKANAAMYTAAAACAADLGDRADCEACLRRAKKAAEIFDAAPDYDGGRLRFYRGRPATAHDDFGQTAREGILQTISQQDPETAAVLLELWDRMN